MNRTHVFIAAAIMAAAIAGHGVAFAQAPTPPQRRRPHRIQGGADQDMDTAAMGGSEDKMGREYDKVGQLSEPVEHQEA